MSNPGKVLELPVYSPKQVQGALFGGETPKERPVLVSYGMGVDSTAMLVMLHQAGIRPSHITFADTGNERSATYEYYNVISAWLRRVGFPRVHVVRYALKRTPKHVPFYNTLGESLLTNCSLPSISYGRRKSCSIKHKVAPQQKYDETQADVQATWAAGEPVVRLIGYDAGDHDQRRYAHSKAIQESEKERYLYRSPLLTAGWDRKRCQDEIADAGLPVPEKSSCYFCASVKPDEVRSFKQAYLVFIVAMEARAEAYLTNIDGLWRKAVKGERGAEAKPGKITDFIRDEGLLSSEIIDHIVETIPKGRVTPAMAAQGVQHVRNNWLDFLETYLDEDEKTDPYFAPEVHEFEELVNDVFSGGMSYFCGRSMSEAMGSEVK